MADLTWTSEIVYDENCGDGQNWVSIAPAQGGPSDKPKVTVAKAANPTDCAYATIIITSSSGEKQIIPVARCLPEYDCEAIGFTAKTIAVQEAARGTVELGGWTGSSACASDEKNIIVSVDGNVLCDPVVDKTTKKIKATLRENPDEGERTGNFYFKSPSSSSICKEGEVKQKGKEITPTSCGCGNLVIDEGGSLSFDGAGGTKTAKFHLDSDGCVGVIPEISVSEDGEGWIHYSTSIEDNKTILAVTVDPNTTDERSGGIIFSINGDECKEISSKFINVSQEEGKPVVDCGCNALNNPRLKNVPKEGSGSERYNICTYVIKQECLSKYQPVSVSFVSKGGLNEEATLEVEGNSIYIKGVTENQTTSNINFSFEFSYTVDGTPCSDIQQCKQLAGDECYYTMDNNVFDIDCNKSNNVQELTYKIISVGCTGDEDQTFTVSIKDGSTILDTLTITGHPTGGNETLRLLNEITPDSVSVEWKNEENGDTGSTTIDEVGHCEHPTPHVVVPKLELMVTFADTYKEYINRFHVNYDIIYKGNIVKSSSITPTNRFECSEKVTSHTEAVDQSTFDDGEISDYKLHFDIVNVHGWTIDCGSYAGNYEFLWQTLTTGWTDIRTLDINLADAPYNSELGMITLQLLARQKQN